MRNAGCTHMLDQVALAIAHAARGTPRLDYRMEVEADEGGVIRAEQFRDEVPLLQWRVVDGVITGGPLDGVTLAKLPVEAAGKLAPDLLEAAVVLRRAVHISGARVLDMDDFATIDGLTSTVPATCYSMLPEVRHQALRNVGSMRNHSAEGRWPLAGRGGEGQK